MAVARRGKTYIVTELFHERCCAAHVQVAAVVHVHPASSGRDVLKAIEQALEHRQALGHNRGLPVGQQAGQVWLGRLDVVHQRW